MMRDDQTILMDYGSGPKPFLAGDLADVYRGGVLLTLRNDQQRPGDMVCCYLEDDDPDIAFWPHMTDLVPLRSVTVQPGVFGKTEHVRIGYEKDSP